MPRTRDFFLLLVIVVFLVISIGSVLLSAIVPSTERIQDSGLTFSPSNTETYTGVVPNTLDEERSKRVASLQQKIAAGGELFIFEGDTEPVPEEPEVRTGSEVVRCATYVPFVRPWNGSEYSFRIVEGARVLTRTMVNTPSATTSDPTSAIAAILPLSPLITTNPSCLETDVIGFTTGGALIRNTDITRYQSLSENSLIGYALDGFPIYGPSEAVRDQCGGQFAGGYRYQVASTGDALINCFSAVPYRLQ
jgi:hypothetical protein